MPASRSVTKATGCSRSSVLDLALGTSCLTSSGRQGYSQRLFYNLVAVMSERNVNQMHPTIGTQTTTGPTKPGARSG